MNKFNIGDKVLPNDESNGMFKEDGILYSWYEVFKHEKGIVDTYPEGDTTYAWAFNDSELQLIEQDTKEDTQEGEAPYPTAQDSGIIDPPTYKELYEKLLEEYEYLNEELYIAKTAIKMKKQLKEKYLKQFEDIEHHRNADEEVWHCEADDILTNLLKELGYKDIVDKFNSGHKWYS